MGTVPFLGQPDLGGREILNVILQKLTSDPGTPVEGQIFYRDDLDRPRFTLPSGVFKNLAFTDDITTPGADSVTNAILANMAANTVKANITGSADNPTDVTLSAFKTWLALSLSDISGDGALAALSTVGASEITDGSVTNTELATMATGTVKANITGGTAAPVDVTKANFITWLALSLGDISGDGALAALSTVGTSEITARAVTAAKLFAASATSRVLGRITAGSGDWEELTGANIRTILGTLDADTLGGDSKTTIKNDVIATIVASAPGLLDTLDELAAALGDDPNFATTITALIAAKGKKGVAADLGTASADAVHNHALGTRDVICQLQRKSDWKFVIAPFTVTDTNNVTWNLDAAPSAGQFRSVIIPAIA